MRKKKAKAAPKPKDYWAILEERIKAYAEASRADEMKGGGDPDSIPVIEAELELARARLNETLTYLRREYDEMYNDSNRFA